jgi:hypothetical protein
MSRIIVMPNYRKVQPHNLTVLNTGTPLPSVDASRTGNEFLKRPEKIFIQSLSTNTESVMIGVSGVLSDGTLAVQEITPGSSTFLPSHVIEDWELICASGGQELLVSYMSEAF